VRKSGQDAKIRLMSDSDKQTPYRLMSDLVARGRHQKLHLEFSACQQPSGAATDGASRTTSSVVAVSAPGRYRREDLRSLVPFLPITLFHQRPAHAARSGFTQLHYRFPTPSIQPVGTAVLASANSASVNAVSTHRFHTSDQHLWHRDGPVLSCMTRDSMPNSPPAHCRPCTQHHRSPQHLDRGWEIGYPVERGHAGLSSVVLRHPDLVRLPRRTMRRPASSSTLRASSSSRDARSSPPTGLAPCHR